MDHTNLSLDEKAVVDAWWHQQFDHEYEFIDNDRYAHKDNASEEIAYFAIKAQGCCGYVDVELPLPNGQILMYGFNYGH